MATCARPDCTLETHGKSKYCKTHKGEAFKAWKAKIQAASEERDNRNATHADLFRRADEAGRKAADACTPTPMVVTAHADQFDDSSPVAQQWVVDDGVCGFAWVTIRPGNCSAAIYAKKNLNFQPAYGGGMQLWVSSYNQSMARKEAYAEAYAGVLRTGGIQAYAGSRED